MGFLETLSRAKEVEVCRQPGGAVELRHVWMPYNRPLVFMALTAFFVLPLVFFFGLPRSREGAAIGGSVIAFIVYALAAQCFNHTRLSASVGGLSWRHRPLPWRRGSGWIAASEIAAISFGDKPRRVSREEADMNFHSGYQPPGLYAVSVLLRDGRRWLVFHTIAKVEEAEAAARDIARALGGLPVKQATQPDPSRRVSDWLGVIVVIGTLLLMILIITLANSE